jgi:hypothetical protein
VLHVLERPVLTYSGVMTAPPPPPPSREQRQALQKQLHEIKPSDTTIPVEHLLEEGDPTTAILQVAQERRCDLIVMGTHGRTGLGRLLMGSVAEQSVRKAPCPVLTVKLPQPLVPLSEPLVPATACKGTSIAEALGPAHAALLEDLRQLGEATRPESGEGLAELRARLSATQTHITEHFRFEEQNGYMDAVQKREPRLERAIQQLSEEHGQLAQSLAVLIEQAKAATSLDEPFREAVRQWIKRVREHEARENELVQDAFDLDIGAED